MAFEPVTATTASRSWASTATELGWRPVAQVHWAVTRGPSKRRPTSWLDPVRVTNTSLVDGSKAIP
jgi:hypothetical protein